MSKPLIGVTPLFDRGRDSYWMLPGYFLALEEAGAVPVMLPLLDDEESLKRLVDTLDGFLIAGGQDVSPALYGEETKPTCKETCPERDAMESVLLRLLWDADKPVFGICRGLQILNAHLGGTLYQDLLTEHPSGVNHRMAAPYDRAEHSVSLLRESPLHALLNADSIGVNSCHHQAIKTLAPGLQPMAISPDGLVEAVYAPEKRFVWAVQWHPEFFFRKDESSRKLFQAFVRAAGKGESDA
ncbi:MAG: gamma-glutamyl-gamma-aminobutyrate hydrolase family protein [Clostridia bacterium]|nr:gamma-glutamyl-gamma-aminobutyrate hydrolase family protein [Clostridia bacterium]